MTMEVLLQFLENPLKKVMNKMEGKYDVIVIGSGVVGSSVAYHLSESKDQEIMLIDKDYPLSGTSGSTQAWVWVHSKIPSWYGELSMLSAEMYPFLKKKIGDVEYKDRKSTRLNSSHVSISYAV